MAEVKYRLARKEDIPSIADVCSESINDLISRNNLTLSAPPRHVAYGLLEYYLSTGAHAIVHVAELKRQIVAVACALLRDHIWYLNLFWARPDQQRKGIGMPLLKRVWNAGKEAGACIFKEE